MTSFGEAAWPSGQGGGLAIRQPRFNSRPALTCYTTIPSFISSTSLVNSELVRILKVVPVGGRASKKCMYVFYAVGVMVGEPVTFYHEISDHLKVKTKSSGNRKITTRPVNRTVVNYQSLLCICIRLCLNFLCTRRLILDS